MTTTGSESAQEALIFQYVTNRWSRRLVQPLLITLMVTALFAAFSTIISLILQDSMWLLMPVLCFVMVLEGITTTLWLRQPGQRSMNRLAYRVAEIVVILLVTRFYTWFVADSLPDWRFYLDYLRHPVSFLIDPLFAVNALFIFLAWTKGVQLTTDFSLLAIDHSEAVYYTTPKGSRNEDQRPFQYNRAILVAGFFRQWVYGGIIMAFLAAISTYDLQQLANTFNPFAVTRLGLLPQMLLSLIVYFITGFLLMSQARLQATSARWLQAGVTSSKQVERAWHRHSTRLLLIVAFFAALLPIGSTNSIGRILDSVITFIIAIFTFLYTAILALITLLIPRSENTELSETIPATPDVFPTPDFLPPADPVPPNETAAFVFSSAFWAVAIVMSIIAVTFFLRERGVRLNQETVLLIWQRLRAWAQQLWQSASQQAVEMSQKVRRLAIFSQQESVDEEAKRPFRFIRVNALTPREQIRYFYLSTVRRASEKGVERRQDETPLEYAQDLKEAFPDTELDVETLTDAFVKARYSPEPVEKAEVTPIKRRWKHMRSSLRRKRSTDSSQK